MTLNQIKAELQTIATNHPQINHFHFGEEYDFASSGVVDTSAMIVSLEPHQLQGSVLNYNFKIYIGDLVQKDLSNKDEVLSDSLLICLDVIDLLGAPTNDFVFDRNVTLNDFEDSFDCELWGYWFIAKIRISNPFDRCAVPQRN